MITDAASAQRLRANVVAHACPLAINVAHDRTASRTETGTTASACEEPPAAPVGRDTEYQMAVGVRSRVCRGQGQESCPPSP